MAATCTHRVITPDTGNTPNTSGNITFASGDLLVVFVTKEASALSTPMASGDLTATSVTGVSSFTLVRNQGHQSSAAHMGVFVADQKTTGSGSTGTVTIASGADAGAGTIISVYTVAGLPTTSVGSAAVRQSGGQTDQASGVPAPAFPAAALTTNPCLGAIYNATNPAGMTEPSGWSAGGNSGYTTGQVSGLGTCHRNSGETGTTITWGSSSASAFASIIIELSTYVTGSTTVAATLTETTVGKLAARGASVVAATLAETTVGRAVRFAQVAFPVALAETTAGIRGLRGQTALPSVWDSTTVGRIGWRGLVDLPVTWDATTDGSASGGVTTLYGATTADFTAALTTAGKASVYYHPLLDSQDGEWTTHTGGSNLADQLDEHVVDDADYIRSELRPVDSACRMKLEPAADPDLDKYHSLNWRVAKSAADGNTVNMQLRLYQGGATTLGGGTLIASFDRTNVSDTFTTYHEHLSEAEAGAITNYADLYVELEATVV